ncbi:ATP-binding protein [Oleomonas cavernae]|uniref:ATP-binding protein n=1 Tax=Oleomonas cavernae TaxID=2320859 RepID=UPI0018F49333|nr:ATP-binding protein [Oleomonas cavernae]
MTTLIENSRQAGAHRVRLSALVAPEAVTLLVADDGSGIAPGDRARLFEPFFTTRRAQGGTGLGLPIARSLLAASRSTIDCVEAAQGCCFRLVLRRGG